jgi:hypothetical protein
MKFSSALGALGASSLLLGAGAVELDITSPGTHTRTSNTSLANRRSFD